MKYLFYVIILLCCSLSVYSQSEEIELQTLNCWSKSAISEKGTNKDTFKDGIRALDNYLMSAGYLGTGTPEEYMHFAASTKQIIILKNTPDLDLMKLAWNAYATGAPDVEAFGKCINEYLFPHINEMDSSDALFRLGKVLKGMESGTPDTSQLEIFYRGLTKEEMNRPFVKTLFYFVFTGSKSTKIKFE